MGNVHPNIRPGGLSQKDLVDALYMIVSSIYGICAKLDADGATNLDTDYEEKCCTDIFTVMVEDSVGNTTGKHTDYRITPIGISDNALLTLMYQVHDAWETLCEKLDADDLAGIDTNYEALCYTALFLHMVENQQGSTLGNGNTYTFRPGGVRNDEELIEWLYNCFDAIETLTEKADLDAMTDADYEALWYTANCVLMIENKKGSKIGVSR